MAAVSLDCATIHLLPFDSEFITVPLVAGNTEGELPVGTELLLGAECSPQLVRLPIAARVHRPAFRLQLAEGSGVAGAVPVSDGEVHQLRPLQYGQQPVPVELQLHNTGAVPFHFEFQASKWPLRGASGKVPVGQKATISLQALPEQVRKQSGPGESTRVECACLLEVQDGGAVQFRLAAECGKPHLAVVPAPAVFHLDATSAESLQDLQRGPVAKTELRNNGTQQLVISEARVPFGSPALHVLSPAFPVILQPGQTRPLRLCWEVPATQGHSQGRTESTELQLTTNDLTNPVYKLHAQLEWKRPVLGVDRPRLAVLLKPGSTLAQSVGIWNKGSTPAQCRLALRPQAEPTEVQDSSVAVVQLAGAAAGGVLEVPAFSTWREVQLSFTAPPASSTGLQAEWVLEITVLNDLSPHSLKPRVLHVPVDVCVASSKPGKGASRKRGQKVSYAAAPPALPAAAAAPSMQFLLRDVAPFTKPSEPLAIMRPVVSCILVSAPHLAQELPSMFADICAAKGQRQAVQKALQFMAGGWPASKLSKESAELQSEVLEYVTSSVDSEELYQRLLEEGEWMLSHNDRSGQYQELTRLHQLQPSQSQDSLIGYLINLQRGAEPSWTWQARVEMLSAAIPGDHPLAHQARQLLLLPLCASSPCGPGTADVLHELSAATSSVARQLVHAALVGSCDAGWVRLLAGPGAAAILDGLQSDSPVEVLMQARALRLAGDESPAQELLQLAEGLLEVDGKPDSKAADQLIAAALGLAVDGGRDLSDRLFAMVHAQSRQDRLAAAVDLACSTIRMLGRQVHGGHKQLVSALRSKEVGEALAQSRLASDFGSLMVPAMPSSARELCSETPCLIEHLAECLGHCSGLHKNVHLFVSLLKAAFSAALSLSAADQHNTESTKAASLALARVSIEVMSDRVDSLEIVEQLSALLKALPASRGSQELMQSLACLVEASVGGLICPHFDNRHARGVT